MLHVFYGVPVLRREPKRRIASASDPYINHKLTINGQIGKKPHNGPAVFVFCLLRTCDQLIENMKAAGGFLSLESGSWEIRLA